MGRTNYRRVLRLEPLEDRRLLANVTVSNLNDVVNGNTASIPQLIANPGADGISLREAVTAANADATADSINFSVNGTINLSNAGQLVISRSLTINGPGSILLTIRAHDPSGAVGNGRRVFEVNDNTAGLINATINDVTITGGDLGPLSVGGDDGGAGIWNRENLTITDSVLSNNRTQNNGGAIRSNSSGTVTLINCSISGNTAGAGESMYGGGVYAGPPLEGAAGQLVLITTHVSDNSAHNGGGIASRVSTTVSGGSLSDNTAGEEGGGAWVEGTLTITGSTISGNSALANGGGIYVAGGGQIDLSYSSVSGNSVTGLNSRGGGLSGGGTITSSTISGNTSAGVGGGATGALVISNSTISGNTAAVAGGGLYRFDVDPVVIRHSTISGNTAPAGAGSGVASAAGVSGNEVQIHSSIVAGNTNSDIDLVNGAAATIESLGFNLVGSGSGIGAFSAGSGDKIGLNPLLGALAFNGGSTMTRALLAGSPAIDGGSSSAVAGSGTVPSYDQRGAPFGRVQGARIDIGAFESTPIVPSPLGDYNRDSSVNAADYVVWRKTLGTTGLVAYAGADGSGNGTIDTPDHNVWRENFGETGSGATGDLAEANAGAVLAGYAGAVESTSMPRRGATWRPEIHSTDSDSADVASMVWLSLYLDTEPRATAEEPGPDGATSDDTQVEHGIEALDAVFDLLATI